MITLNGIVLLIEISVFLVFGFGISVLLYTDNRTPPTFLQFIKGCSLFALFVAVIGIILICTSGLARLFGLE